MRGANLVAVAAAVGAVVMAVMAAARPVRISCAGDSITAGVCSKTTHGYPAVLQTLLGDNFTVRGDWAIAAL